MAPWHHVGATMEITLDKNGSLYDPAGTESWNMQTSLDGSDNVVKRSLNQSSTVQTEFCRYKWLIRPLIHRNAIASLDWIGKSAPVPLHYI